MCQLGSSQRRCAGIVFLLPERVASKHEQGRVVQGWPGDVHQVTTHACIHDALLGQLGQVEVHLVMPGAWRDQHNVLPEIVQAGRDGAARKLIQAQVHSLQEIPFVTRGRHALPREPRRMSKRSCFCVQAVHIGLARANLPRVQHCPGWTANCGTQNIYNGSGWRRSQQAQQVHVCFQARENHPPRCPPTPRDAPLGLHDEMPHSTNEGRQEVSPICQCDISQHDMVGVFLHLPPCAQHKCSVAPNDICVQVHTCRARGPCCTIALWAQGVHECHCLCVGFREVGGQVRRGRLRRALHWCGGEVGRDAVRPRSARLGRRGLPHPFTVLRQAQPLEEAHVVVEEGAGKHHHGNAVRHFVTVPALGQSG